MDINELVAQRFQARMGELVAASEMRVAVAEAQAVYYKQELTEVTKKLARLETAEEDTPIDGLAAGDDATTG